MDGDGSGKRVLVAQGLAALAYFFCVHGAHAATVARFTHADRGPAQGASLVTQLRRP